MNINRHNYEEFFILYMDNELNDGQRHMVEAFVQEKPDLKEELDILLQSKLIPDNSIVFESKGELIKTTENIDINLSNYEEWLLLYTDNELSVSQKNAVEEFAAQHPIIKTELGVFNKTKLLAEEEIVFPNKELLYRKTEKVRIVSMRWWRIAVAALLILAIGITRIIVLSNQSSTISNNTVAGNKPNQTTVNNLPANNKREIESPVTQSVIAAIDKQEKTNIKQNPVNNSVIQKNNFVAVEKNSPYNSPAQLIKNKSETVGNIPSNNLAQPTNNPNVITEPLLDPALTAITSPDKKIINPQTNTNPVTDKGSESSIQKAEPEFASLEEGSNKKTRGFFRKAIRLFSKTTKINPTDDDDRLMIGGLAVKLR
ncbi:MAG TPA: hypothetical protein VET23_13405 [Chitinophagaceae bacterium]|nr:hypothetical protein [Chitinophagaceae bacterium]